MALADACGKRKLAKPQLGAVQTRVASDHETVIGS